MSTEDLAREQLEQFCVSWREIDAIYEEYAKSIGVSYSYLKVLDIIYFMQQSDITCTQKNICEQSFLPKQTVNSIITSLYKDGLLELKETPADRRNKMIVLTGTGMERMASIVTKMIDAQYKAFTALTSEARATMVESITAFKDNLRDYIQ